MIKKDRVFAEINLENLEYNIEQIKKIVAKNCKIMAVIKADAYGHGMVEVAQKLNSIGISNFAVATLDEAITLRKNKIFGNILILGYTDIKNIKYVEKYDLIQTIVDYEYAEKISKLKYNINAHIKINTGMNRIGESYKNISNIENIFKIKNIKVIGMYTHLSVSDSLKEDDVKFTKTQIDNFYSIAESLKKLGHNPGKIHIQSSYGLLNYNFLKCDFVRVGIIMYGIYEKKNSSIKLDLKNVLTLKAKVASVKEIDSGEAVSYGRTFIAKEKTKVATITIGYADGYPRNLSNKNVKVLINGKYGKIIGRICMDMLMVDVTGIDVKQGDIVTLIGKEEGICANKIASASKTISYELLSGLGKRVKKVYIGK